MSAWIVSKAHIDCLVQALIAEGLITFAEADATGQMLWHENYLSIQARYGDEPNTPEYHFEGIEAPLSDAIVSKAEACYGYQTCEHRGWESGEAYRLTYALASKINARHGLGDPNDRGYWSEAERELGLRLPWGIDNLEQAIAR